MPRLSAILLSLAVSSAAFAQDGADQDRQDRAVHLSPGDLFALAGAAQEQGDFETAENAYRALSGHPDEELRTEARFRLAMMLHERIGKTAEAAVLLRQILDEKPDVSRVRVELARMHHAMGDTAAAERELRAAQASGLPPEVEQLIQFYASSLRAQRPYGLGIEVAIAPDTNVNRATKSDTLGTIIGDFDLSEDARAQSGIGLSTRAHLWGRLPMARELDLRAELNGGGEFYRTGSFDDYSLGMKAGPVWRSGVDTLALSAVVQWRWFGGAPYTFTYGAEATFRHPLGRRSQLRADAATFRSHDRLNTLRSAYRHSISAGLDRAFSARAGGGFSIAGQRNLARDPGYSTTTASLSTYFYREVAGATLVSTAGYSHLQADQRIFIYPEIRVDRRFNMGLTGTLRWLKVGTFAPIFGVSFERNRSSIEIYDYRRLAAKAGITGAF